MDNTEAKSQLKYRFGEFTLEATRRLYGTGGLLAVFPARPTSIDIGEFTRTVLFSRTAIWRNRTRPGDLRTVRVEKGW